MPLDGVLLRQLEVQKARLDAVIAETPERRLVDPLDVDPIFERWAKLYDQLVAADSEFGSVPKPWKPTPFDNKAAYDGRGGYVVENLKRLRKDIAEAVTIGTHPSKQGAQVSLGREGVFLGGQPFDAMMAVTSIIRDAKKLITLVDAYVCDKALGAERTLSLLSLKGPTVNAQVLTHAVNAGFVTHAKAFVQQYGSTLEVRTNNAFHDRFLVVDDAEFFSFGASIKDAAVKSTFMFSRIEEPTVITTLRNAIAKAWAGASVVQL